jgi:hypothetical protein
MTPARTTGVGLGRLGGALLIAGALGACADTRPYRATADDNLRFTTAVESSWLSSVEASVHIHSVDRACRTAYEGTVPLARTSTLTGIPAGRPSYLVIAFDSASFLANRRSSINYETMLTPRPGYDYEVAVRYVDDTYDATIREVNRQNRTRRDVRHTPLAACRAEGGKSTADRG